MRLATLNDGSLDGRLILVSQDGRHATPAPAATLIDALLNWTQAEPALRECAAALETGKASTFEFDPRRCAAPLPRSPQWLDASAFLNHGRLMERAFGTPPIPDFDTIPVMYQGASDDFLGPHDDVPLPGEADGIDFEGEFGVIVGEVPMGATPAQALAAVRLVVQLNDWSLRALGQREVRTGFGFLQAKPSTAFAPIAVTPDALGPAWQAGRLQLRLHVDWNGRRVGTPSAAEMNFDFGQLIAHAARTRRLRAGTLVGSGTVSNADRAAGSACIAELRMVEKLTHGEIRTGFMKFGDRVRMQACLPSGEPGPFGAMEQQVVPASPQR